MDGEKRFWEKWNFWIKPSKVEEPTEEENFMHDLHKAHEDWQLAQQRLELVTSPELIDHAIYVLEAAEKKYSFYLRKAREQGIRVDIPYEQAM